MADKEKGGGGGDPISDLWWFIGFMVVLGALWLGGGGAARARLDPPAPLIPSPLANNSGTYSGRSAYPSGSFGVSSGSGAASPVGYRRVRLGRGTAAWADKPGQEYITLSAPRSNAAPVVISGWTLANSRGEKLTIKNSRFVTQSSFRVAIPNGAFLFSPTGNQLLAPIALAPGERAIVSTGSGKSFGEYPLNQSFKVNKCIGYVAEENDYDLTPTLPRYCPAISEEIDLAALPDKCYDFARRLSRCHIPEIKDPRNEDWSIDGRTDVPKTCANFIMPYLSYRSCVARHAADPDFYEGEWRIFLGQIAEMWASRRETITLYDSLGNVVDQISY